jgi:Nucleotidyltransferase of unknown function (DUF6036)
MPKKLNKDMLEQALALLAEKLEFDHAEPASLVVCGGSSLIALGLVNRTTKDVDVLALMDGQGRLLPSQPLPEAVIRAVAEIAGQLDLDPKWLNGGPTDLLKWGLPEGFQARLTQRNYGKRLTVWYISRLDQIHFKVFAATDAGPGRHVNDLVALNPSQTELLTAARWALTQDASEGFVMILKDMLRELGYEDIVKKL